MRLRPVLILFGLAAVAGCSADDPADGGQADPRTVEVRMSDDLRFDPAEITVAPGETVRFELVNDGQTVHEFLIGDEEAQAEFEEQMSGGEMHHDTEAGISVDPGETASFDYTFPDTPGELLAGCHEPGHYDGGMVATITIEQ